MTQRTEAAHVSSSPGRPAAFFDVDGTITRSTTLFDLLRFDSRQSGRIDEGERFLAGLRTMQVERGESREAANRHYYRWWAGRTADEVENVSHLWVETLRDDDFHARSVGRLRAHLDCGDLVCLVSGSVPIVLGLLAQRFGIHHILSTTMTMQDGRFTGEIDLPMIGETKARAVRSMAEKLSLSLKSSAGYGDHASDVPFLAELHSPVLCASPGSKEWALATERGWGRMVLA
jgi:HAD superfamily hydrolase (TIGR01490 family)